MPALPDFITTPFTAATRTLTRYDSENPFTAGQVRAAIGGVLIVHGLIGIKDPASGRRRRAGILASAICLGVGLVFGGVGFLVFGTSAHTDATANGTIATISAPSQPDSNGDGGNTCTLGATFEVAGESYTSHSEVSSSSNCHKHVGDTIEVSYDSADPNENNVGMSGRTVALIFTIVGSLFFLAALFMFLIRLASIVFGIRLLLKGRKMIAENPQAQDGAGVIEEARAMAINLLRGRPIDAASTTGTAGGAVLDNQGPASQGNQSTGPVAPPVTAVAPGWYATADGHFRRWHDGTTWTDRVEPAHVPPPVI